MDLARKLQLIDDQITAAKNGFPEDFDEWRNRTAVVLRRVVGELNPLYSQFTKVKYSPGVYYSGMDTSGYRPAGVRAAISILDAAKLATACRRSGVGGRAPTRGAGDGRRLDERTGVHRPRAR